jgi:hypothetical protein
MQRGKRKMQTQKFDGNQTIGMLIKATVFVCKMKRRNRRFLP